MFLFDAASFDKNKEKDDCWFLKHLHGRGIWFYAPENTQKVTHVQFQCRRAIVLGSLAAPSFFTLTVEQQRGLLFLSAMAAFPVYASLMGTRLSVSQTVVGRKRCNSGQKFNPCGFVWQVVWCIGGLQNSIKSTCETWIKEQTSTQQSFIGRSLPAARLVSLYVRCDLEIGK